MNVIPIPLDQIDVGDRLRTVDEDYAELIAAGFRVDGQRTPIEVRATEGGGRYRLISGGHRVRAAQLAGLSTLSAVVLLVGQLDAERLEIEENLCRRDLSELDRAVFLARWQAVHDAMGDAPAHGGRRTKGQVRKNAHLTGDALARRFTSLAAERLGVSEGHIRRAKHRATIIPEVRARIARTWVADNGVALDGLSRLQRPYQMRFAELVEQFPGERSFPRLRALAVGARAPEVDADLAQFDALLKLWRKSGAKARRMFEHELAKDAQFQLSGGES